MIPIRVDLLPDAPAAARRAAECIAAAAHEAVRTRGCFIVGLSGGSTPLPMLAELALRDLPWRSVHLFQVDERVAPAGDPQRNLTHLEQTLLARVPLPRENLHAIAVEAVDLDGAARDYTASVRRIAGTPAVLDLVHLGLGADGHTASLVPGDAALKVADADVAVTAPYQGRRRITLTFPVLNRARSLLWLVTGEEKRAMLARLQAGDPSIPAGRVDRARAILVCDRAALGRQRP